MNKSTSKILNKSFNVLLLLYLMYTHLMGLLFTQKGELPKHMQTLLWEQVSQWSPLISFVGAIVSYLLLYILGAALAKEFWNRFIFNVFELRMINYDEALAIVLVMAILPIF